MADFSFEWEPQESEQSAAGEDGRVSNYTLTRTKNFTASDSNWSSADVKLANGCPRIGDPHYRFPAARCTDRDVQKVSPNFGRVVLTYTAVAKDDQSGGGPLSAPTVKSWSTIAEELDIDEDINGKPIATFANEPISGAKETFYDLALTCKKNFAEFNAALFYAAIGKTNSKPFFNFPKGTAKLVDINANEIFGDTLLYVEGSATFQFRRPYRTTDEKAWWKRLKHEGFMCFAAAGDKAAGRKPVQCVDKNKVPVTQPVFIKLTDGTQETDLNIGHWKEWQTVDYFDFDVFNF